MWGEFKERGTSKGLSHGLQSKRCVLSHACYVLPVAAPGERAGGGHMDEADSFFLCTFGEHSGPVLSCTESTSSAEWPGSVEAGTCSLSCREQDGSVCLIRSGPSPRLSTTTRAHPRIRQRKDASCLPACWH